MSDFTARFDKDLIQAVNVERQRDYGHPAHHFALASQIKEAVKACPDPEMRHILEVLADKMARLVNSPSHYDSWLDVAGYARTAMMVMDHRMENENAPTENHPDVFNPSILGMRNDT